MLTVSGKKFLWNGNPYRIISGSMQYFRVVPQYWRNRLEKMRDFGLNTVETYIPWNLHEPEPTEFTFEGGLDIAAYIKLAQEVGLNVIIRPGPFICAEWEFGGLPYWLLKDPHMQVRCSYAPFLEAVDAYFDRLFAILSPLQSTQGGPIIAMQLENEYGGYGNDVAYLTSLHESMVKRGVDVLLFTSDTPYDGNLQSGSLPGILPTLDFAYDAKSKFEKYRQYHPDGPLMVSEFWSGWFDHWGEKHHLAADGMNTIDKSVQTLEEILATGASLNFYMFHGGTNFGFMNGANDENGKFQSVVTSYDYAAPLTEWGDPSPRFYAYRNVLSRYVDLPLLKDIPPVPRKNYGLIKMTESVSLWDALDDLSKSRLSVVPLPMEEYNQDYGFILYRTYVSGPRDDAKLAIHGIGDRAQVFLDGDQVAVLDRESGTDHVIFEVPPSGIWLDILVENMGRVNFGPGLMDRKGILNGVTIDDQYLYQWQVYPLPMKYISPYLFQPSAGQGNRFPMFFRGEFEINDIADTFLYPKHWSKGIAWVNGSNLGRYWNRGPQKSLYIPGPLLRQGKNEIILLELHETIFPVVELTDQPCLG